MVRVLSERQVLELLSRPAPVTVGDGDPTMARLHSGSVSRRPPGRNWGFIRDDEAPCLDVFFHADDVAGHRLPCRGDRVTFSLVSGRNGAGWAIKVEVTHVG
jgi:cold shock CspA family protein